LPTPGKPLGLINGHAKRWLPYQRKIVHAVGVTSNSNEPQAAKAFVAYLMSLSAIAVIKAKGMNPG